jgi:DNA-binding response OmpR family regulator
VSARDSRADRILGLELGADDYVTKPFGLNELVSRVRAILRRRDRERRLAPLVRRIGALEIDFGFDTVTLAGDPVPLTRSEFRLLALLAERAGEVVTRHEMMEHLWQSEYVGIERAGDIHVSNLRRKLGAGMIETIRGEGYLLRA